VTGLLVSAAFSDKIRANESYMLAAHMNALLGCFWLLGLAFTLQWVRLSEKGTALLLLTAVTSAFANWFVTIIKSFMDVRGIDFVGEKENDLIFVVLTLSVVIPTFISAWLWVKGLRGGMRNG
jgi:hydroxylaminobenzene mutase